ncbi:MAG: 50S ribosomal protein L23 [Spirochaetales bacterium]
MRADSVIIAPVLTEKTTALREQNKFVFRVDARANKIEIVKAVEELFGVRVVNCNIVKVRRKPKRQRLARGFTSEWKKAIVTLAAGQGIEIFEGA